MTTHRIKGLKMDYDEEDDGRRRFLEDTAERVSDLAGAFETYTTPATPDTEFIVRHSLGRIPEEMHLLMSNLGGVLYRSSPNSWTTSLVYLKYTKGEDTLTVRFR